MNSKNWLDDFVFLFGVFSWLLSLMLLLFKMGVLDMYKYYNNCKVVTTGMAVTIFVVGGCSCC